MVLAIAACLAEVVKVAVLYSVKQTVVIVPV